MKIKSSKRSENKKSHCFEVELSIVDINKLVLEMDFKREFLAALLSIFLIINSIDAQYEVVRLPPSITQGPVAETVYYRSGAKNIKLDCKGTGSGTIGYTWTRNGQELNLNSNEIKLEVGSLIIKEASSFSSGYYQCYVDNSNGKVFSNATLLLMAIVSESSSKDIHPLSVEVGKPFKIVANPHKTFPKPTYNWEIANGLEDPIPEKVILGKRIQMNEDGDLYFAYAIPDDSLGSRIYKLITYNQHLDQKLGGSYTKVEVRGSSDGSLGDNFAPTSDVSFPAQDTTYTAVVGRNISLRCFFAAKPEAAYTWNLPGSRRLNDIAKDNLFPTELFIRNISHSDAGTYTCRAFNGISPDATRKLTVTVEEAATFRKESDKPQNQNKTEGESVTFTCRTEGTPRPTTVWYMNGQQLNPDHAPPRMRFGRNRDTLTIEKVCKNCPEDTDQRRSDLMVIQCNSSNIHGYSLGTGYLNVLDKTEVTLVETFPQGDENNVIEVTSSHTGIFRFKCSAKSDPSTPVSIVWRQIKKDSEVPVYPDNKLIFVSEGELRFVMDQNSTNRWEEIIGQYRCHADNSYSADFVTVTLNAADIRVGGASLADQWWIFIIIALILLILILILCCCIYMQRNQGDTYPVDEKERLNGNDPEREIEVSGFQDYKRPELRKGSGASINSSNKLNSEDGGSMNAYGSVDPGNFTEDGSFVGAYTGTTDRNKGRYES